MNVVQEDGHRRIQFDPAHGAEVIRLFADSYLESAMTGSKYLATSKVPYSGAGS